MGSYRMGSYLLNWLKVNGVGDTVLVICFMQSSENMPSKFILKEQLSARHWLAWNLDLKVLYFVPLVRARIPLPHNLIVIITPVIGLSLVGRKIT